MKNKSALSNNIRKYRLAAGYNMKQAAALLHIPYSTYANYESKKTTVPSLDTLINMAMLYNATVGKLLGEDALPGSAIILKDEDIMNYLMPAEQEVLKGFSKKISEGRVRDGKEAVPQIRFF